MAHTIRLDTAERLALVQFSGAVDGPEYLEATRALFATPGWEGGFDAVWDGSRIESNVLKPGDVQALAKSKEAQPPSKRVGRDVVYVRRELDYIGAQLYALVARAHGIKARVCTSVEEVAEALGRPDPPALLVKDA